MQDASFAWVIAGVALLFSIGQRIFNSGWGLSGKLSKMDETREAALTAMESRLAQTIAETARDLENRQDRSIIAFGESIKSVREQLVLNEKSSLGERHALSDQIRKVEIWARDEFVRNESFREVCARIENSVVVQARQMDLAVQSVRDAIITLATSEKLGVHRRPPELS